MKQKLSQNKSRKNIVISAVNLVDGGTFSILLDCLKYLSNSKITNSYQIWVLVNSKSRMPKYGSIEYLEFPKAKKHYLYRFYYEFFYFRKISKIYNPVLWLSLHDMSPKVDADIQAVYMHNSIPFYKPKLRDWIYVPINAIWAYLYKYVYRINIHSNKYLIVQQNWLRDEFSSMFSIPKEKIIVAHPNSVMSENMEAKANEQSKKGTICTFFYPAYPRVFKNFDVICKAAQLLDNKKNSNINIVLTIDGSENGYSKDIVSKYSKNRFLRFVGLLPHDKMREMYENSDCLLFPSKLESWGLPLSEFKPYEKPMIVADLPYAYEAAAGASKVCFFDPDNAEELAGAMLSVSNEAFGAFKSVPEVTIDKPCSTSWEELFDILLH